METGQDLIELKHTRPRLFPSDAWCIECSWEVANKQGGIYTVLRSKAASSVIEMGERYLMMGPLKPSHVHEVEPIHPDPDTPLGLSLADCRAKGWTVMAGRWEVEGNPTVILFDVGTASNRMFEWKQELYNTTYIGVPNSDTESNDVIILGFMMAQFIADFRWRIQKSGCKPLVVTHCHEWMAGVALIMLRMWKVDVATVFTTHATLLGRYLCAGALDFYNNLSNFNVDVEAGKRGIYHRYCIERASTHLCHVFTTVSDITAEEAKYLVKRKPDLITPNGLNVKRTPHELQNLHQLNKEKIKKFVHGHFHGHINFDMDKTLFFFMAGRYEFGNKGGDIFIESLSRLNHYLKACNSDVTVIAFIIFPAKNNGFNVESLKGHALTKSMQETIGEIQSKVGQKLYEACCRGEKIEDIVDTLISRNDQVMMKRVIFASQSESWPPVTSHKLVEEEKDPVMIALKRCNLLNSPTDRVKVVFHPDFLKSDNPLLGMKYEEFVRGCHMGVFPSYYEPWGYTPAECTIMGVPSVTTNLSGFGCFIEEHVADPKSYGIHVLDRRFLGVEESVKSLSQLMFDFSLLTRRQRIIMRNRTERLSDLLDWSKLGVWYTQARSRALTCLYPDLVSEYVTEDVNEINFKFPRTDSSFSLGNRREVESLIQDEDEIDGN